MSREQNIRVPPEIIDHVFSFLQSDPTTLAICSRAHPGLSPIAQRHLYVDIVVCDNESEIDDVDDRQVFLAADLHKLLIDSLHIANYVRKLEIRFSSLAAKGIAPILPMLMQLDGIFVTAKFFRNWLSLAKEFLDAFTNRLSAPLSVLKEVSILHFDRIPLSIFDNCKTVTRIGLHGHAVGDNDLPVVLDSLSLRSWQPHPLNSEFMKWARKHIHNLRFLLFHSSDQDSINEVLPELLRICSNSLSSLEVDLSDGYIDYLGSPFPMLCVGLSSVQHLKDLTIRSNLHEPGISPGYIYDCAFPPMIIQLLETTPCLNNLTLIFGNRRSHWSPLLTFLSSSSHKFRHIELQLYQAKKTKLSVDTLQQLCDSKIISDLIAKGILDICIKEWQTF